MKLDEELINKARRTRRSQVFIDHNTDNCREIVSVNDNGEQIEIAFQQAQKEVDDLHQRTREGMMTAKLNGKQIGRKSGSVIETKKSKAAKEIIKKHSKAFGGTLTDSECQKLAGISRNSFYKYKRELASRCSMQTVLYP